MAFIFPLVISSIIVCSRGIPLDEFFPYGVEAGDSLVNRTDDGSSPPVFVPLPFRFLNTLYSTLFVNNNGHISFNESVGKFNPQPFVEFESDVSDLALVAPYWADVDTEPPDGGWVWYRVSTDNSLKRLIQSKFSNLASFTPDYMVIVTWDHVGYFNNHTNKTNTFQCILATDIATSFIIYQYADDQIQWTTGDASEGNDGLGGNPALVGYSAGDGVRYEIVPGSMTAEIINITTMSNVGIPGVFVFKVDGIYYCPLGSETTDTFSIKTSIGTMCTSTVTSLIIAPSDKITTTTIETMCTSTVTSLIIATNAPSDKIATTSIGDMASGNIVSATLVATNTPSLCRPDCYPEVSRTDNKLVLSASVGGAMGVIILIQSVMIVILLIRCNVKGRTQSSTISTEDEHKMTVTGNTAYGVVAVREEHEYELVRLQQIDN